MITSVEKPNIVWVFADQLRGQALAHAGDPNVRTPNIDRLAAEGVRFTSACSTYPVCVPFRFTLLTGEYAHSRWIPALNWRMSPQERTLAHVFNEAGYETAYVGKWHLNGSIPFQGAKAINRTPILPGFRGGFSVWHGFNLRNDYDDTCIFHGDSLSPTPLGKYQTEGLFDIAIDYVRTRRPEDQPFFLSLSVEAPHPPNKAPPGYAERVRQRGWLRRPNYGAPMPEQGVETVGRDAWFETQPEEIITNYYGQIENLDDNIGRLLSTLEETGLQENTVLMFFSDHGELLGSHSLRQKQFPMEESINIPFIVHDPRLPSARRGAVVDEPICTEDIFPTTLGLAGLKAATTKPGLDLGPVIRGETPTLKRDGVYLEFVEEHRPQMPLYNRTWRGFRTTRWKYTVLDGLPWQLFDLQEDPYEMTNLVHDEEHADIRLRMHEQLRQRAVETADSAAVQL